MMCLASTATRPLSRHVHSNAWSALPGALRRLSDRIQFGATDSEVEELIESSLDKTTYRKKEDVSRIQLLTTRREATSLYREILRVTRLFVWRDQQGRMWCDVLRQSARQEFEAARFETDPEIINRLLLVGRDSVHQVAERFLSQRQKIIDEEAAAQQRGGHPPFRSDD